MTRCLGCGRFGRLLCVHCRELCDLIETRKRKLETTVPMVYWRDPLRLVGRALADHIRRRRLA